MGRIRKLSSIEANMAYMHALLNGNTQVTTRLSIAADVTAEKIELATEALFRRYQILRCCIRGEGDQLYFHDHDELARVAIRYDELGPSVSLSDVLLSETADVIDASRSL